MFYLSVGLAYGHYGETDTGPKPSSFVLDGPSVAVPVVIAGIQITRSFALGVGAIYHPFYAVGGPFVSGAGFGGLGLVFSPSPSFDLDLIAGGGGMGVSDLFGGTGPAGSLGATFYPLRGRHFALGPSFRLSVLGVIAHYRGGDDAMAIYVSPMAGIAVAYH
jgi:hypothetical protein